MNTLEVERYLKSFKNYCGTFPRDLLPQSIPLNGGVIINTDKSSQPGSHWVAVYKNTNGLAIYFDSFGMPPLHKEILSFLARISSKGWYYNTITFQSIYSDTCGNYCVFFLANMFKSNDFDNFRAIFNHRPDINDNLAKILYKAENSM